MTKKTLLFPFYFFLLLISPLSAEFDEDYEDAFYALSSLNFHLEEQLWNNTPESDPDRILFEESDVANLWSRAKASPFGKKLEKAQKLYQLASETSLPEQHSLLLKARQIVNNAWENLNPFYLQPLPKTPENEHRFILSKNHWLSLELDRIFTKFDAKKNHSTFKKAGFKIICKRTSNMIVADHPKLPGYIIKIYLREDKPNQSWRWLCNRCEGAENIRQLIKSKNLKHFTVPDKWIYPIPDCVISKGKLDALSRRTTPALLVATKMNLVSFQDCRKAWKEVVRHSHLRELYCILSHGFASTYILQNIPYTQEGKFACLDTEIPYRRHDYSKIYRHLSDEMKIYWDIIVKTGGKP